MGKIRCELTPYYHNKTLLSKAVTRFCSTENDRGIKNKLEHLVVLAPMTTCRDDKTPPVQQTNIYLKFNHYPLSML